MDLFQQQNQELASPLAEKMRPQSFGQIKGQDSIFSTNRRLISGFKQGRFQSLILWGPPAR